MWTCESCGTQGIANDLMSCPACGKGRDLAEANGVEAPRLAGEHGPELTGLAAGQTVAAGGVVGAAPAVEPGPAPFVVPRQADPEADATEETSDG